MNVPHLFLQVGLSYTIYRRFGVLYFLYELKIIRTSAAYNQQWRQVQWAMSISVYTKCVLLPIH